MVANNDWFVHDDWRTDATAWHCSKSHVSGCDKMTSAITTTVTQPLPTITGTTGTDQKAARHALAGTHASDAHERAIRKSAGASLTIPTRLKQGGPSPELMSPGRLMSPESGGESRTDTPIQTPQIADVAEVLGFEETHATSKAMSAWKKAGGGRDEPLPEEVILVPTTGRSNAQVYDDSPPLSPTASTVSCTVTSPAPISQASSPSTVIQFAVVPSKNDNNGHNVEVGSELGSPYSFLSTPSTAIPSPYNKLVPPSLNATRFTDDYHVAAVYETEEHADIHQQEAMTRADATVPQSQRAAAASRWSMPPADLPQNYFGTGLAVVRPSAMAAVSYDMSMTPPIDAPAVMSQPWEAAPLATGCAISMPYMGSYEASSHATHLELPPLPSLHPVDDRASSHRVLNLNEDTAVALAYWFAGCIVSRLAHPSAAIGTKAAQRQRRYSETHFDPYHVVPGHSYANGQITVAYDLAFNMYQILERVQNAETLLAAVYFLERLPLHDVDGNAGREFRTLLIPRRAGDLPFALERRVASIVVMLAQNTLEDRDYHLPNNMMWQIGGMEKTRFNRLKLLALQDLEWNVHIKTDAWQEHITKVGTELYAIDLPGRCQPPVLEHDHVEILARVFSFMYEAANQGYVDAYVPSAMANYVPLPHLPPLAEDHESSALSSPAAPIYPTPPSHHVAPVPAVVAPVPAPAVIDPMLDGAYLTRKAMQEARAQRAREAYLQGKLLPTPPPPRQPTPVDEGTHTTTLSASEMHQRRKAAQEARARRARAAYLQRTYLQRGRSSAMILA